MLGQGGNHNWGRLDSHIYVHSNLVYHKILMVLVRDQLKVLVQDQLTSCDGGECHIHNHTQDILVYIWVYILGHIYMGVVVNDTLLHGTQDGVHIPARDPHLASPH